MKPKFAVMLAPLALALLAGGAEAQQHRATRLGNPATRFARRTPEKPDDVRIFFRGAQYKPEADAVLKEAGWPGDIDDLDRAAATAEVTEIAIAPGTRIPFMASRDRKTHKPHALVDLLWAGRKPIRAYAFEATSKCVRYRVITPRDCGNFWVEEIGKDETTPACAPPPPPPVVTVTAGPTTAAGAPGEVCVTQPIDINVTVQNPPADNKVAVEVNGKELMSGTLTNGAFKATFPGSKEPGTYQVKATSGGVSGTTSFQVKPCIPTCGITVTPNPAKTGKPITVDVTGSRVAAGVQGGIKSAHVEVLRKGEVVDSFDLAAPKMSRDDVVIKKSGVHTIRAVVTDEAAQASTNTCQADVEVKAPPVPLFAGAYFGKERLVHDSGPGVVNGVPGGRCAPLVGVEVGIQPKLGEKAEVEVAVGGKINTRDSDNSSIFGDLAINGILSHGFFGGGISAWDLTRDNGSRAVALLVQGGVDLTKDGKWQLVVQGRAPFNKMDDFDNNYQFWGGFRFRPFSSK